MRYFQIPADVHTKHPVTGEPLKQPDGEPLVMRFAYYFENAIANDDRFKKSAATLRRSVKVSDAVHGKRPGDVVALEDADWEVCKAAAEEPSAGHDQPMLARQMLPFIDAIVDAKTAPPAAMIAETAPAPSLGA